MSIASDSVAGFRTRWASRFVDTCTIDRQTSAGTFNATTGQYDSPSSAEQYSGGCLIRPASRSQADFGEKQTDVETYSVFVPHDTTGILVGDEITVTTSISSPDLVGAVLTIREIVEDSYHTKYELIAERAK